MDPSIPLILTITAAVIAAFLIARKRELNRLHRERGYDAPDPNLTHQAHQNTKAKFRTATTSARRYLELARALILAPLCAAISALFLWVGWPNNWQLLGFGAFFALAAILLTRIFLKTLRRQ